MSPARPVDRHSALERLLEQWLFRARWLMAPFYVGLALSLLLLLYAFALEGWHAITSISTMAAGEAIVTILGLIDLSLAGSLVMIVIFSGYENFVSKLDTGGHEDRPAWMGTVDFSGLKIRVIASIVALSAVALLRLLVRMSETPATFDSHQLGWFIAVHLAFVTSGVLLALMDYIAAKTPKH